MGRKGQHKMSSFGLVCDLRPGYQGEWLQNIIINEKCGKSLRLGLGEKNRFCFRLIALEVMACSLVSS